MNSLNILSSRVIGQPVSSHSPRPRSRSQGPVLSGSPRSDLAATRSYSEGRLQSTESSAEKSPTPSVNDQYDGGTTISPGSIDEKTSLLHESPKDGALASTNKLQSLAQRLFDAIAETLKVILSTMTSPVVYFAHTFRDEEGYYSFLAPARRLRKYISGDNRTNTSDVIAAAAAHEQINRGSLSGPKRRGSSPRKPKNSPSRESMSSTTSESDADRHTRSSSGGRHSRSKSGTPPSNSDESTPRRSIRIKLNNESNMKRRQRADSTQSDATSLAAESLKSPISSSSRKLTKYPHAPAPPRPLIPPRQPSYATGANPSRPQKTLVLDLDETLIHSLAKGGRMSSGHMVEVKLSTPMATSAPDGPTTILGPQHPILYYVHKRPHCDDFLRKICKWYKLVIFTASVQEYADPVIDWLEQERKFFHSRYYRQHCTFRNGAYIKDLSSVEPDLSKVMILDNSPTSYIFHEGMSI